MGKDKGYQFPNHQQFMRGLQMQYLPWLTCACGAGWSGKGYTRNRTSLYLSNQVTGNQQRDHLSSLRNFPDIPILAIHWKSLCPSEATLHLQKLLAVFFSIYFLFMQLILHLSPYFLYLFVVYLYFSILQYTLPLTMRLIGQHGQLQNCWSMFESSVVAEQFTVLIILPLMDFRYNVHPGKYGEGNMWKSGCHTVLVPLNKGLLPITGSMTRKSGMSAQARYSVCLLLCLCLVQF